MPVEPGARFGPYEILGHIGSGGMGEVYRARDPRLGREVAIKILPPERLSDPTRRARFVQEARSASSLNHPHIVTIYEIESADGVDFIVMELVPGKTLDSLIPKSGMRLGEALRVAIPIADALTAAHAKGIVHRDLKPGNVMVTPDGVVKVLDFGLAKLTQADEAGSEDATTLEAQAKLSHPGTAAGTPAYMSPEQASGGVVDARSDIFSFGVALYEMVTGRRPFAGSSSAEIHAALLKDQPRPPSELVPEVPKELERIILHCLRKDPGRRFQHMVDVRVELQELKEESDSASKAPSVPVRRKRGLWLAAALVAALVLTTGGLLLWRSRQPRRPPPYLVPLTSTPGNEAYPTFSPDGQQIAYMWDGESVDNPDIYVKMIGPTEAHRLTTDPAIDAFPSWSPDGRQIAFVRASRGTDAGTIHVISPLGGSDRKLSEQPVARNFLSWSADGRWVATGAPYSAIEARSDIRGLRLIDTSSGEVRSITSPTGSNFHTSPAFSPDGRHLAFFSCVRSYSSCRVEVVEVGADSIPRGAARPLTRRAVWSRGLAWARDGRSVVYGDGVQWRLWRVGIAGEAPPERIEIAGYNAFWPAIAVSRDRLAFMRSATRLANYRFAAGRSPEPVATSSFSDRIPHLSRDGLKLAWESGRGGEGNEIWVAAADGKNPTQLTRGPGLWQGSPRWSPDGHRVAFDSFGEDGQWDIWTIDADGGPPSRLTSDAADDNMPSWSSDGRFVYFSSNRTGARTMWRIASQGGSEELVARSGGGRSQEAPDGRTLFYQRADANSPLLSVTLAGGPERTVIDCLPRFGYAVGAAGVYHLACSGDARGVPLLLRDPATGRDRLIGTLEHPGEGLTVSRDGKTILYTKLVGEGSDLVLIENFR